MATKHDSLRDAQTALTSSTNVLHLPLPVTPPPRIAFRTCAAQRTHMTADRVFLDCRGALASPVRRACRTRTVPLAVELIQGHGAGGEREPSQTPGCRRARGPGSGMAGLPAWCLRTPGAPGPGGGRQPGIIEQAGVPAGGRTPVNLAVEPAGAVPGRRGYRRVQLSGASRQVVPSR